MKRLLAILVVLLAIVQQYGFGQLNKQFVPFLASGYTFQFVKSNSQFISSFYTAGSDPGSGWSTGPAAFGTLNNTSSPPCPLNDTAHVHTLWPSSRDLLLRRHITLPSGAHNLKVTISIDNGVQAFFNGKDISGGIKSHNDCATGTGDFLFPVPDSLLRAGDNVIAIHGTWISSKAFFDMQVVGDVYYTITVNAAPHGSISPTGPVTIYPNQTTLPTFTVTPDSGYRTDSVVVDGVNQGKLTTYTFQNLNSNHSISAYFSIIRYVLNVTSTTGGSVSVTPSQTDYAPNTVVKLTAYANSGYHFSGWSGNLTGTANPTTITMDGDKSVTPAFIVNTPLTITVSSFTEAAFDTAINQANQNPGPDVIVFSGSGTINLSGPLPILTDQVTITAGAGQLVTLQPSGSFPNDTTSEIFSLSGIFLSWGYTPQQSTITGFKITGFPGAGICIQSNNNTVQGCTIVGNGGDGICIEGGSGNLIGGILPGQGNTISNNAGNGVSVRRDTSSIPPSGNGILGNLIFANGKLGIDLGAPGVTPNAYQPGPSRIVQRPSVAPAVNYGQNYPILFSASVGTQSVVKGSLLNWPHTNFRIEIFSNPSGDPSGYGQGQTLVASQVVTTNDTGYVWFEIQSNVALLPGQSLSATATDLTNSTTNTSEFSADIPAGIVTKKFGPGYVVNTTISGIPLHWPDGQATYVLSSSVPGTFASAIDNSFATWSALSGTLSNGTPWSIHYTDGGSTSSQQFGGTPDGINNVVWVTTDWLTTTGVDPNVIALTRVRYNAINGEMTDVDIAVNAKSAANPTGFDFGISPADSTIRDVQDVATHEAGHFSGLGDIYNPGYPPYVPMMGSGNELYTMYGIIRGNETLKRSLEQPDIDGITWIYQHAPQAHIDVVLVFDGSSTFISQYAAFDAAKHSAAELIQRMGVGDRVGVIQLPNSVIYPLQPITSDTTSRTNVITAITNLAPGGSSMIGAGLQAGESQLSATLGGIHAMILFSAGEETGLPAALSVVPSLIGDSTRLFTLGFSGSTGQDLNSRLADTTGGAYYLASSATMSTVVKEIWNRLTALQMIAYTTFASNQSGFNWQGGFNYQGGFNWQGGFNYQGGFNWQGGFNYQGAIDDGTLKILPGFNWQGSVGLLALVPPQDNYTPPTTWVTSATYTVPYGVAIITPDNWNKIPAPNQFFTSIRYVKGETYNFYEVIGPKPGKWTLIPGGDASNATTVEQLDLSIIGLTDVTMQVTFSKSTYQPGAQIQTQVTLSQGGLSLSGEHISGGTMISDATVQAQVTIPGSSTPQTITLSPLGNGLYTGTFSNTSAAGTYEFKFLATGNLTVASANGPVQVAFTRQRQQSVYVAPPFVPNAVLVASGTVTIGDTSAISSGSVLVNNKGGVLTIGLGVSTPARFTLKADKISIGAGSAIVSDVFYNTLTNAGTIGGSTTTPLTLPLLPSLPTLETANAGTVDIKLSNGQVAQLVPGSYRDVVLSPQAVLTLTSGGTYNFRSIWVKSSAQFLFTGKTDVRVSSGLRPDNGSYMGPANGSGITESDIVIYVAVRDAQSFFTTAVNIGPQAHFYGNVEATNGTIWLQDNTTATGAYVAKDALVGKKVQLKLNTSFAGLAKIDGTGWTLAPEIAVAAPEIPTAFSLSPNYPNPFNPTTQIRYGLPVQSHVTITVYNVLGQEVTQLVNTMQDVGYHEIQWNGMSKAGVPVGTGIYFLRFNAGNFVATQRMMLLK